jgi:uncharacterized protein (DUF433 family)
MQDYVEQRDGAYYIAGTRIVLDSIVLAFKDGESPEKILQSFPMARLREVREHAAPGKREDPLPRRCQFQSKIVSGPLLGEPQIDFEPKNMPIGAAIEDLLLIWQVSEAEEWVNRMRRLPI